ncbi:hypothetical protein DDZ13_04190 [Coraliomargarita sinensis]|uniref:Uncharacterized protein n=1 Tax=Coraliomargarita sinensis TaxID=2174842 RepID=A0A317ZLX1_9BACT|nr:hypothetical protein [Coraliomargarita sinensis]PXA05167.1 hypothetical protein DDZ13_04190 [Coraliomargarita sinensis]
MAQDKFLSLTYRFSFPDGSEKKFVIKLNRESGKLVQRERDSYPEWTRLSYKQCQHCPLKIEDQPRCPVAVSLIDVVEFFQDSISTKQAVVTVESGQRITKRTRTNLSSSISSIIGIYMATSGCPIMDKLRPMARFHLPFADTEETVYRALSMYALAQYFRHQKGLEADWDFQALKQIYSEVNQLNIDFARRLRNDSISEATTNAITSLDCFAQEIDFSISEEMLEEIETLFEGYA